MSALILAASAGALVEQIGSYAGLAAVLGLAIMSLLYFSQAREVRRLREWAGREPERAAEIAQRVQGDPQRRVVAEPLQQPATPAAAQQQATAALYASVGATPPGAIAPAGQLARPAATPAAGLLPAPGGVPQPGTVNPAAPGVGAAAAGAAAAGAAAAGAAAAPAGAAATPPAAPAPGAPGAPQAPGPVSTPTPPVPAPSPGLGGPAAAPPPGQPAAATAAAAAARTAAAASSPPLSAYANGSTGQDTHESAAARPEPLMQDDEDDTDGLSLGRVATFVGGGIAAVAVVVVLMIVLTGGDDTQPPNDFGNTPAQDPAGAAAAEPGASDSPSGASSSSALTAAERRATKVAVLNGTTQSGLARNVGDKIEKARFTIESVGNNVDQQIPTTVVSYTSGNEPAARAVAKLVGVDTGAVQPADANAAAAADADVVVTVGLDQSG